MSSLRFALPAVGLFLIASFPAISGDKKEDKVAHEVYAKGYFVKNNAPLPGNPAFLVLQDKKSFDQIFGFGAVMGAKPKLVDEKLFEGNVIMVVIKSGSTLWKYEVQKIRRDKDQLVVEYGAMGKESTAKFNSPLIVSVPRGDFATVVFVENGKEIAKAPAKK